VTPTEPGRSLTLRAATPDDRLALGEIYVASRAAAHPAMPASVHTAEEDRAHFAGVVDRSEVWVAEQDPGQDLGQAPGVAPGQATGVAGGGVAGVGRVVGFAAVTGDWLDGLYVHPDAQGLGIGTALLEVVKAARPDGFSLWVFQTNLAARRLYERHGLIGLERTDGYDNEERAPDLRMAWPGRDPLTFLRRQVDAVDDDLATLLARRAALTAAIQPLKPVSGHAGRDADREAEIAERMAARAPALGPERIRRIMHEVITTSLDATE
jgi:chorismate mutase/GNAT superfamily N-acetyltransferase